MEEAVSNTNDKIWVLWNNDYNCNVIYSDEQQVTYEFQYVGWPIKFKISFIYAKCRDYLRRSLWDRLLYFSFDEVSWCTIRDFNVITTPEEKKGGIMYNMNNCFDFISIIKTCRLTDLRFNGQTYTWCYQRAAEARVWKRLDREMVNNKWLEVMPQTTIDHLPAISSDHTPLLMEMTLKQEIPIKYFKFLHCWTDNSKFLDIVRSCWNREATSNPIEKLHLKMKRLTSTLSSQSKRNYGDISATVKEFEEKVRFVEDEILSNNVEENRANLNALTAEYVRFMKSEEGILRQKTQL